jgi:SAM-dependent methyltransferase/acyl carrier protein
VGWTSSYFDQPIPTIQMQEWVGNTIKRIALMKPRNVLEIGCGTGLLLFRLSKVVTQYFASDFSSDMLTYLKTFLPHYNINNVHLIECQATDTHKISQCFDTIILNSVIQYFPSVDYLLDVISQCIQKIAGKGQIFIGDVRSLHLLEEFHASVLLNKQVENFSLKDWKYLLTKAVNDEDELVLDFNFFHFLKNKFEAITHVEILLKEGKYHNEMNAYRYDVVLYINHEAEELTEDIKEQSWCSKEGCGNLASIHSTISEERPPLFLIKNIPNRRIANVSSFIKTLPGHLENWNELVDKHLLNNQKHAIDPEIFYQVAKEHDYHASITWSSRDPHKNFDVLMLKKSLIDSKSYLSLLQRSRNKMRSNHVYANNPLLPLINRKLIAKTKKFLQAHLPHYMIPNYFIPMEEIPITSNGKIDRNALPKIITPTLHKGYSEPYTDTQKKLLEIWRKMLGIETISIKHNFFELGGTSLLSIELLINIHDIFGMDLTLQDLTTGLLTIENLGALIDKKYSAAVNDFYS